MIRNLEGFADCIWDSIKNIDDFEERKKIIIKSCKNNKIEEYTIFSKDIGRNRKLSTISLEINEKEFYFPFISVDDINKNISKSVNSFFERNGWFIMRSIPNGLLEELYKNIDNYSSNDKVHEKIIGPFLNEVFPNERISHLLATSFNEVAEFNEFNNLIEESFELYVLGYYKSAILSLIPCIEGIFNKVLYSYSGKYRKTNPHLDAIPESLKNWIDIIYPKEHWFPSKIREGLYSYLDEIYAMKKTFLLFLKNFLYLDSVTYSNKYPFLELNRHGIIHGRFKNYGNKTNWLLLFSVLDFLLIVCPDKKASDKSLTFNSKKYFIKTEEINKIGDSIRKIKNNMDDELDQLFGMELLRIINESLLKSSQEGSTEVNLKDKRFKDSLFIDRIQKNLKIRERFNMNYMEKADFDRKIIRIVFGHPNVITYGEVTEKDLALIIIDDGVVTNEEIDNSIYKFSIDSKEKKVKVI